MTRAVLATLVVVTLPVVVPGPALAADAAGDPSHWRLETEHGPVHVWQPRGYASASAGVVVYVHGLYTDVDRAWDEHRLARQFGDSRANAVFVVPEAPSAGTQEPFWPQLDDLLRTALEGARIRRPPGPLVVVGHSGAYRQILLWLDEPRLKHIILLDGLYGGENLFADWARRATTAAAAMTVVTSDTRKWTEHFLELVPDATRRDGVPSRIEALKPAERDAHVLVIWSQIKHMQMVTDGKTMPVMLQRAPLRRIR